MPRMWPQTALTPWVGYAAAVIVPIGITFGVAWLSLPAFVFEHLILLVVLAIAIPWGQGPAVVTAVVSVMADNVLLREPIGRPTISGHRDVIDLLLFATVAVVVSALIRQAHKARIEAERAAFHERRAREERDRLIATVAHDLATPLAVLSGAVQFAKQRGLSGSEVSRLVTRLETASARATSLVRTLTDVQALESAGFELRPAVQDLRTIVAPIVEMMDRFSERHPVLLTTPAYPVFVNADAERLQRVVENLVGNAIKYSPDGGAVEVSVSSDDGGALLQVRDYGMGIPPDALPYIFERSFRAPDAVTRAPGLGIGLSIVAQVVQRHGGTVTASAADEGGTLMAVRLPLAPRPAPPAHTQHRERAPAVP